MKKTILALALGLSLFVGVGYIPKHDNHVHRQTISLTTINTAYADDEASVELQAIEVSPTELVSEQVVLPHPPEGRPEETLAKIFTNWKEAKFIYLGMLFVLLFVQMSNAGWIEAIFSFLGWKNVLEWKRAISVVGGSLYGVLALIQDKSPTVAIILAVAAIIGSGAIYEAIKGLYYAIKGKNKEDRLQEKLNAIAY